MLEWLEAKITEDEEEYGIAQNGRLKKPEIKEVD